MCLLLCGTVVYMWMFGLVFNVYWFLTDQVSLDVAFAKNGSDKMSLAGVEA